MGYYLNSKNAFSLYESETRKPYFVDKTQLLSELLPLVEQGNNHICITRPRRFGKSVMAAMIASFFGKGVDSSIVFGSLKIAGNPHYREHLNQHDVIYLNFSEAANLSKSYDEFVNRVEKLLTGDLRKSFPDIELWEEASSIEYLKMIHAETGVNFIFVFDEWDCIFHKKYITKNDKESFINFLAALTKDTGYISLSYM
ncbi:MAG: AAA family ATPase, partial [Lachnospiraceae bacterium]|nr:AAA family ATPase [Lachnospiraceae bacterium]